MKNMFPYFSLTATLAQTTSRFVWMEKNIIKVLIRIDYSPQTWNGLCCLNTVPEDLSSELMFLNELCSLKRKSILSSNRVVVKTNDSKNVSQKQLLVSTHSERDSDYVFTKTELPHTLIFLCDESVAYHILVIKYVHLFTLHKEMVIPLISELSNV